MNGTFKKTMDDRDKTVYIDIRDGYYSETVVDDYTGFPNPGGWYECDEDFVRGLFEMGYEEL